MILSEFVNGEHFYFVYTNKGHNLILVTRNGILAMQINAALKNKSDDSDFRIKATRNKKAP